MAYLLQYFDEVLTDVQEAKSWYKEQREGLEEDFSMAIEKTIAQILKIPTVYAIRYKNVRIAHPKKFPYNIHFYIDEPRTTVVITAIIHHKRKAAFARKRIK